MFGHLLSEESEFYYILLARPLDLLGHFCPFTFQHQRHFFLKKKEKKEMNVSSSVCRSTTSSFDGFLKKVMEKNYARTWRADSIRFVWEMCSNVNLFPYMQLYSSLSLFNYYQMFQMLKCYALCTVCVCVCVCARALVSCTFQNPNIYIAINLHEIK